MLFCQVSKYASDLHSDKVRAESGRKKRTSSIKMKHACGNMQKELRQMENSWWVSKAREIQSYADTNDTQKFMKQSRRPMVPRIILCIQ